MLKYLTGDANATIADAGGDNFREYSFLLYGSESSEAGASYYRVDALNSLSLRAKTLAAGTQGNTSYAAKTDKQDINVRLGGLDWTITFLSEDESGDIIATLWLNSNKQDAWADRTYNEGEYYGFIDGALYSGCICNYSSYDYLYDDGSWSIDYEYDAEYLQTVVLNNGGLSDSSAFALFTMPEFGLTDYLVTPQHVDWQQSKEILSQYLLGINRYVYSDVNEYCSVDDDYLWLPDLCEIGSVFYNNGRNYATMLWGYLSESQLKNNEGNESSEGFTTMLGNYSSAQNIEYAYATRSINTNALFCMCDDASSGCWFDASTILGIRPALHLNLTAIAESLYSVGELFDSDTKTLNEDNYNALLKNLTGNDNATLATVTALAETNNNRYASNGYIGTDASVLHSNYYNYSGFSELTLFLGGMSWTPVYLSQDVNGDTILTLWFEDGLKNNWGGGKIYTRTYTDIDEDGEECEYEYTVIDPTYYYENGEYYYFESAWGYDYYDNKKIYCYMKSSFSAGWRSESIDVAYPSNMYGTSYINAVTLNNGGFYAVDESTLATATKNSNNPFAILTMPEYGLTQYLVTPRNVSWQKNQEAILVGYNGDDYRRYNNESCTSNLDDDDFPGSKYNYSNKQYYDQWADSYVWLPSLGEVGKSAQNFPKRNVNGLWNRTEEQYSGYELYDEDDNTTCGLSSGYLRTAYLWWNNKCYAGLSGVACYVDNDYEIRPAIHLNLTAIYEELYSADLSDGKGEVSVSPSEEFYDGSAKTPTIRVKYNGVTLAKDVDYTLSYTLNGVTVSEFKTAGIYTITATGKKSYTGSVSTTYTIAVLPSLSDGKGSITVTPTSEDYTGTARAPTIVVKYNGTTLTLGTDYTLSYTLNGSQVGELILAGTYTITAIGIGDFRGSISTTYTINGAAISGVKLAGASKFVVFKRTDSAPRVCLMDGSKQLAIGIDYTITHSVNFDELTGTATVTFMGGYTGTKTLTYTLALLDPLAGVYVAIFA